LAIRTEVTGLTIGEDVFVERGRERVARIARAVARDLDAGNIFAELVGLQSMEAKERSIVVIP